MNSSAPLSASAEEQASLWAARLDGSTLSTADRAALDAWLAAHPAHRALLSSYCQFSADLEQRLPLLEGIREDLAEKQAAPPTARSRPWLRWPTLAGAMLTAAAAVAVVLWRHAPQNQFQNVATPVAQRSELALADGSHVELNAHTALVVDLKDGERRVRLASGEAFFRVSRDANRPFFVETPAGLVRVTGTQFNVRTVSPDALEVTVLEGSVQVRPGAASTPPRQLAAGDRLVAEPGQVRVATLTGSDLANALAWRQGRIVFEETPLREALTRFAHYHGRNLTASDAAARLHVGGVHSLDDLDGFLTSLEQVLPSVRVLHRRDGSVRVDATAP